jgi:hypothetical protein
MKTMIVTTPVLRFAPAVPSLASFAFQVWRANNHFIPIKMA